MVPDPAATPAGDPPSEQPGAASAPDDSERRAMRRAHELLGAVFDGLGEALLLLGPDGEVLAVNRQFTAVAGAGVEALVGRSWREHDEATAWAFPDDLIAECLADGSPRRRQVRSADALGRTRILSYHLLPLSGGAAADLLVVRAVDETEQVQVEARMLAAERLAANERLAAIVAHEVNTPLQAIESSLHLAGRLADEEQRAGYLRLAREEIQRIGHILRQLLELHRPRDEPALVEINDLVERVLLLMGGSLRRSGIHVQRELAAQLPPLVGRADELTQVFMNLVVNAVQAMPRGGRLTVSTAYEQPAAAPALLVVTVSDNGPGIEPGISERIFEPFYTTRPEGSGLGLAVSQQLVESHGGRIGLSRAPEGGASFRVELPASRPTREAQRD